MVGTRPVVAGQRSASCRSTLPKPVDLAEHRPCRRARRLPPSRPAVGRGARQDRGRRAGIPHRLAGPAPVRSGARVPLAAGLCLPEPERRCAGASRSTRPVCAARLRKLMEYAVARLGPRPRSDERHRRVHTAQSRPPDHRPSVQEGIPPRACATEPRRDSTCAIRPHRRSARSRDYYGVIFTFRIDGGGTLGMLWNREGGRWKIVSYQPLAP